MDQLTVVKKNVKCTFCGFKENDYMRYGPVYRLGNIRAHYYCVLLSNELHQNGKDEEGMLGFLLSDMQKELDRSLNIICIYCGRGNATIKCNGKKCSKKFHLPCGMRNGSLHQFMNDFKSFCRKHRPTQTIPCKILKEASKNGVMCCICYDSVDPTDRQNVLWAPCCLKTWYHRYCVQKLAHNAGYFFRCAACNDVNKFKNWMQRFGIFVPQQYEKCDAKKCKCPEGREKNSENTMWEIVVCDSCGSQGIHIACGNLKFVEPEWECADCAKVTKKMTSSTTEPGKYIEAKDSSMISKLFEMSPRKRRRASDDLENSVLDKRKRCRKNLAEEEIEIDVETVEDIPREKDIQTDAKEDKVNGDFIEVVDVKAKRHGEGELEMVLTSLRPGPLSFKLSLLREARMHGPQAAGKPPEMIDLISLRDSDEEDDDGEQVLEIMHFRVKKGNGRAGEDESCDEVDPPRKATRQLSETHYSDDVVDTASNEKPLEEVIVISDNERTSAEEARNRSTSEICRPSTFQKRPEGIVSIPTSKLNKTDHSKERKKGAKDVKDDLIILLD